MKTETYKVKVCNDCPFWVDGTGKYCNLASIFAEDNNYGKKLAKECPLNNKIITVKISE